MMDALPGVHCREATLYVNLVFAFKRTGHAVLGVAREVERDGIDLAVARYGGGTFRYQCVFRNVGLFDTRIPAPLRKDVVPCFAASAYLARVEARTAVAEGCDRVSPVVEIVFVVVVEFERV